jgi:hypothetical protein
VRQVKEAADRLGLVTKRRTANGLRQGGKPFSRGHLYKLLSNPIYIGRIAHKSELYQTQHEALIDDEGWAVVQARLAGNGPQRHRALGAREPSLLIGLLFDAAGDRLSPSHAVKTGRRYRYYVSRRLIAEAGSEAKRGWWLPAHDVEQAVIGAAAGALRDRALLIEGLTDASAEQITTLLDSATRIAATLEQGAPVERAQTVRELVGRVVIGDDALAITLRHAPLLSGTKLAIAKEGEPIRLTVPLQLRRRGVEMKLVIPGEARHARPLRPDPALIKAVARGHLWFDDLATGRAASLREIAEREGVTEGYVGRLMRLAFLAPRIVEAILEGAQAVDLTAARLTGGIRLPLAWSEQHQFILA